MASHKRDEVIKRLARIHGHVHSIMEMVREDRSYPEVAQQISAVRAALDGVFQTMIEDLVEDCVKKSRSSEGQHSALQLKEVIARSR